MLIRNIEDCPGFLAGDKTRLREYLHPDKQPVAVRYSLAHATLKPGGMSLKHRLSVSVVYFNIEGEGLMFIEDESRRVTAGDVVYLPPHCVQCIRNMWEGDLMFLCIVDPAWKQEYERVEEAEAPHAPTGA